MIPQYIFYGSTLLLLFILILWNIKTEQRLKRFFRGAKGENLEKIISEILKNIDIHEKDILTAKNERVIMSNQLTQTIRNSVLKHYSAFNDGTAKQSFTIALLNDLGDGILLTNLYARERVNLYAKNIIKGKPVVELTEEESEVLQTALNKKTI